MPDTYQCVSCHLSFDQGYTSDPYKHDGVYYRGTMQLVCKACGTQHRVKIRGGSPGPDRLEARSGPVFVPEETREFKRRMRQRERKEYLLIRYPRYIAARDAIWKKIWWLTIPYWFLTFVSGFLKAILVEGFQSAIEPVLPGLWAKRRYVEATYRYERVNTSVERRRAISTETGETEENENKITFNHVTCLNCSASGTLSPSYEIAICPYCQQPSMERTGAYIT